MSILHRLLGIYVVGVAAVVAVSLLATLIWSNGAGSSNLADRELATGGCHRRGAGRERPSASRALDANGSDGSVTREYLEVNLLFYVSIVVTVWFFWNWLFFGFFPDNEPARRRQRHAHDDVAVHQRAGHPAPGRHRLPSLAQSRRSEPALLTYPHPPPYKGKGPAVAVLSALERSGSRPRGTFPGGEEAGGRSSPSPCCRAGVARAPGPRLGCRQSAPSERGRKRRWS